MSIPCTGVAANALVTTLPVEYQSSLLVVIDANPGICAPWSAGWVALSCLVHLSHVGFPPGFASSLARYMSFGF